MSIQQTTYVIHGILMPYVDLNDDQYVLLDEHDENAKVTILHDGMSGKYTIIGHIIAKSEHGGGFNDVININDYKHDIDVETVNEINDLMDIFTYLLTNDNDCVRTKHLYTYIVTHYS